MDFGDILSGVGGLFESIYNISTNKRDFDYQKALQQQIFEREDTAVQRRMEDLKAAGINPNLAAGSAASAGAVVGRSETPNVNFGSLFDTMLAKKQLDNSKIENYILNQKSIQEQLNTKFQYVDMLQQLGFDPIVGLDNSGKLHIHGKASYHNLNSTPYGELYKFYQDNQKNSADILQKQNNWFTTNQILNAIGGVAGDISLFTPKFVRSQTYRYWR